MMLGFLCDGVLVAGGELTGHGQMVKVGLAVEQL